MLPGNSNEEKKERPTPPMGIGLSVVLFIRILVVSSGKLHNHPQAVGKLSISSWPTTHE